ncbi:MAG TPA: metallophosphoesterase [Polyangia bacterium]|jgi:hypothetical protein|nr:metallophosphoesterase [Polyangia bacterium]
MVCLCLALVALAVASGRAGAEELLTRGPYVQNVVADGFTVVCDTPVDATIETRAGAVHVTTTGTHHEAVMRGVTPTAGRVSYRVLVDGKDAGGGEVQLPDAVKPVTFVVYGDTRNGQGQAVPLATLARSQAPAFILYTGDLAVQGNDAEGWQDFFTAEEPLLADVPLYPALGNHEIFHDPEAHRFREAFALPDDGRRRLYYAFRWGALAFIVLDGNAPTAAQTEWLKGALDAAEHDHAMHTFVLLHQPPLSVGAHCGAALEESEWVRLFEQHRVSAVFAGHDHAYERLERNGVRYFVSGGGGAPLYDDASCGPIDRAAKRMYRPVYHLLRVRVEGPSVEVSALPLDEGAPLEVVRFANGEPMFASDAPPIGPAPPESHAWSLAGGALFFVLVGLYIRRKR